MNASLLLERAQGGMDAASENLMEATREAASKVREAARRVEAAPLSLSLFTAKSAELL